ncbi:MAG: hypothetical protein GX806_04275 [Lentisphaerae bacterium]|nr:hypothetical protein [Lentisphaerota bacterium]
MKRAPLIISTGISLALICYATALMAQPPPEGAAAPVPAFTPGKMTGFQPVAVDPELGRQSMQAWSEYEALNRKIMARQTKLYEENPTIQELQDRMREIQKKIDAILDADEELRQLQEKFKEITPSMPAGLLKPPAAAKAEKPAKP